MPLPSICTTIIVSYVFCAGDTSTVGGLTVCFTCGDSSSMVVGFPDTFKVFTLP